MIVTVDSWSPGFGSALLGEDERQPTPGTVDVHVELPAGRWAPLRPAVAPAADVCFVDGVRRIDARVWLADPEATVGDGSEGARLGLCVSYAAGVVRCGRGAAAVAGAPARGPASGAHVEHCVVRRGLFAPAGAPPLAAGTAVYEPRAVASNELDALIQGVQQRLGELEIEVAATVGACDLVVVDGPLSGRQNVPGAIGYVKSHRVDYLPAEVAPIVGRLAPGERTPLFVTQTSWSRYSWYLRLPHASDGHPWSGVVRGEASADLRLDDARRFADLSAATLPRFASQPHKDGRAPQNLYPIGGLERHLRRRLGDHQLLHRGLRTAARS